MSGLITRLQRKSHLIHTLSYQLNIPQLKVVTNAIFDSIYKYGLSLWSNVHPSLTFKIDEIRVNTIHHIYKSDVNKSSDKQILRRLNWFTTPDTKEMLRIFKIQKILYNKYPVRKYDELTRDMTPEDISNMNIITTRTDTFNNIPVKLKKLKPVNFKKKYKTWIIANPA